MFEVGKLAVFHPSVLPVDQVIDRLHSFQCFSSVNKSSVQKLKENLHIFTSRVDFAVKEADDEIWKLLCNEPKSKLKGLWKVKKESGKGPKSEAQKCEEAEKHLFQAMYYCLYVVLFWRHEGACLRYGNHLRSKAEFLALYENDPAFPRERMDSWDTLLGFRNVMLLAAAIKPSLRNKGLFTRLGCILAEDRIHTMGGGQSFAADRRGYIYDTEGSLFATLPAALAIPQTIISDLPCPSPDSCGKPKRVLPPSLSRGNSTQIRAAKQTRCSEHAFDGVDQLLLAEDLTQEFAEAGELLRNLSIQDLVACGENAELEVSAPVDAPTEAGLEQLNGTVDIHSAFVVNRAFSYNAYQCDNSTAYLGNVDMDNLLEFEDLQNNNQGIDMVDLTTNHTTPLGQQNCLSFGDGAEMTFLDEVMSDMPSLLRDVSLTLV